MKWWGVHLNVLPSALLLETTLGDGKCFLNIKDHLTEISPAFIGVCTLIEAHSRATKEFC